MTANPEQNRNANQDTNPDTNRERIPDDQPAPNAQPRETHQTSEVPLGSGDRPVPPGSGGDSARTTHRTPAIRERNESDNHRGPT